MESLTSTVALVTGASSGIGAATARRLGEAGATLALVARRGELLEAMVRKLATEGIAAHAFVCDIASPGQVEPLVQGIFETTGRIDTLVNGAGIMLNGPSVASPVEEWDTMIDLNLRALLHMTKACLPMLLDAVSTSPRGVADVVNISSTAGRIAGAETAVYNATKWGVTGVTEAWRKEFTRSSLRFSSIEPGMVETPLFDHKPGLRERFERNFGSNVEGLLADDIADAIAYVVQSPRRVAINEILIRPTDQT